MTLLELLREHLKEWPENVRAISQDPCGSLNENRHSDPMPWEKPTHIYDGEWRWGDGLWWYMDKPGSFDDYWILPLADDASTAIVTREMWEGVLPSAHD